MRRASLTELAIAAAAMLPLAACGRAHFDALEHAPDDAAVAGDDADLSALLVGCEMHLAMDEAEWTGVADEVRDSCGSNHGKAVNGATTTLDAERGRVGTFIGDPSCVQVPDAPSLRMTGALTASAWLKPAAVAPLSFGVISKRKDFMNATEYSVFVWTDQNGTGNRNEIYVDIDTENDRLENPKEVFLNSWRQITVVYDGSAPIDERIRFFVDGAFSFAGPETSSSIAGPTTPPDLAVGCLPLTGPAQSMVGLVDDVALWSRALSATEVGAWYEATRR